MTTVLEKADYSKNQVTFEQRERDIREEERKELDLMKRERKSPFASFYQVNKEKSDFLRSCLKENPKALEILFFLFDNMDGYNAVMCSYKVLEEATGSSQATIARSIKYLKKNGFIYVQKSGSSNVYVTNPNLVWNSWGNNKQYCKFPANIVLSASEQENIKLNCKIKKEKLNSLDINDK